MLFDRKPKYPEYEDTPRKRAALARKYRGEQEAVPLFALQIAEEQTPADAVMAERKEQGRRAEQAMRDLAARQWRGCRAKFYRLAPALRADIRAALGPYWGKKNPGAYAYFIRLAETGRLERSLRRYKESVRIGAEWRQRILTQ